MTSEAIDTMKIISIEVSQFNYSDYCNIFEFYNDDIMNNELQSIIDLLGFNIDKPIALGYNKHGEFVRSIYIAKDNNEYLESLKSISRITKLGSWTLPKYSTELFNTKMTSTFSYSCIVDYTITTNTNNGVDNGKIRNIYTMSKRLETVQMVQFIQTDIDGTKEWAYTDGHQINILKEEKPEIYEKYQKLSETVYKFNLEHFEEIDDHELWTHPLFQHGNHSL